MVSLSPPCHRFNIPRGTWLLHTDSEISLSGLKEVYHKYYNNHNKLRLTALLQQRAASDTKRVTQHDTKRQLVNTVNAIRSVIYS